MATKWQGPCVYLCAIYEITFPGHEFLDKIRDPKSWKTVKNCLSAIRDYSLDAINAIAGGVTSAAIASYFEKNPS